MELSAATGWWIAALVLVAAEMATGTFYMLMLALGLGAGAIAAHAGLALAGQFVAAAVVGGGAVAAWTVRRARKGPTTASGASAGGSLDLGGRVHVAHWHADGSARVLYRGTEWDARLAGAGPAHPGEFVIQAMQGSVLLLEPVSNR